LREPLQHLQRRRRVGPRLGMADRNLPAVGEAGFQARRRLAVDDADRFTVPQIPIGGVDADHAGAEDDDVEFVGYLSAGCAFHAQALRGLKVHTRAVTDAHPLCHRPESIVAPLECGIAAYTVGGSLWL